MSLLSPDGSGVPSSGILPWGDYLKMFRVNAQLVEATSRPDVICVESPEWNSIEEVVREDCSPFPFHPVHEQFAVSFGRL